MRWSGFRILQGSDKNYSLKRQRMIIKQLSSQRYLVRQGLAIRGQREPWAVDNMACVNNIVLYVSSTAWQGIIKTTFCRNSPMYALCFHLDLKCLFIEAFDNFFPSFRRVISHILRFSKYLRCNLTLLQRAVQVIHDKSSLQEPATGIFSNFNIL